jgi:hypothetical protein
MPKNAAVAKRRTPLKLKPEVERHLLAAIRAGVPIRHATAAVGISHQSYYAWCRQGRTDRDAGRRTACRRLVDRIEKAEAEMVTLRMARITKAGKDDWRADAWVLERRLPAEFGTHRVEVSGQIDHTHHHLVGVLPAGVDVADVPAEARHEAAALILAGLPPDEDDIADADVVEDESDPRSQAARVIRGALSTGPRRHPDADARGTGMDVVGEEQDGATGADGDAPDEAPGAPDTVQGEADRPDRLAHAHEAVPA